MLKKEYLILLLVIIVILIISPVFSQRRGIRRNNNFIEDSNDIKQIITITTKKTLEQRVLDLEYEIYKLNNLIINLKIDMRILVMDIEDFKLEMIGNKKTERKKINRDDMTWEERDRAAGIFPIFPYLQYGWKDNSNEYNEGYVWNDIEDKDSENKDKEDSED